MEISATEMISATVEDEDMVYYIGNKQYELSNHLGNVLAVITDKKIPIESTVTSGDVGYYEPDIISAMDYSPFGVVLEDRKFESDAYRYGFNGMEKDDEVKGSGNSYDFGARMYDGRLGRFLSIDRFFNRLPNHTPYSFAGNMPLNAIDINGDSLYILFYTTGNAKGDDMFRAAALTRKHDIEHSGTFDPNRDKVVVFSIQDLSDIKIQVERTTSAHSAQYGKTVEAGIWSHAATDGPIGTENTSDPSKRLDDGSGINQMNLRGWNDINFNWESENNNPRFGFYGCNTGVDKIGKKSFSVSVSGLPSYKGVITLGQISWSYPSNFTDERDLHLIDSYLPVETEGGPNGYDVMPSTVNRTYIVGGKQDQYSDPFFGGSVAYPMKISKNGEGTKVKFNYQIGAKKND